MSCQDSILFLMGHFRQLLRSHGVSVGKQFTEFMPTQEEARVRAGPRV